MDDLEDADKQIKIIGQIIDLSMSSPKKESWDWNKHDVSLNSDTRDKQLTHHLYVHQEKPTILLRPM